MIRTYTVARAIGRFCDWYICRIDYGRPNVWRPMYWLYVKCDESRFARQYRDSRYFGG